MPSIGFTVMKEKILNGDKRQTIRKARKRPILVGDTLYLYWHLRQKDCELLKTTTCSMTFRIPWYMIKTWKELAVKDGFNSLEEMNKWFIDKHNPSDSDLFDVIRW